MRKLSIIFVLLSLAASLSAQTNYGLSVAGYPVTSKNADDVMGDGLVSYNANTKTLTLAEGACINTKANEGIYNTGDALTIQLNGHNEINCTGTGSVIRSHKNLTIKGRISDIQNQTLQLKGAMQGIYMKDGAELRIEDCSVAISSEYYNICGDGKEKMTVSFAIVTTGEAKLVSVADLASTSLLGVTMNEVSDVHKAVSITPTDTQAPTLPVESAINATLLDDETVVLNWSTSTDNNTSQAQLYYHAWYKRGCDAEWTAINPSYNMSTATLTNLEKGTTYDVKVEVADRSGNVSAYLGSRFKTSGTDDAIHGIKADNTDEQITYDLSGRRINRSVRNNQIIIRGGKKIR